ncbi:MAG: replication initiator protein [Microvirus sp.]|nr:MAG: replication initiator protein [Microvirus sp.]
MVCYYPLSGYRSSTLNENGKRPIVFRLAQSFSDTPVQVPCGQCVGCRLERSRQWAIRCVHEASLYKRNCFITLTFNDFYLPENRSLDVRVFQLFMKRLRKRFGEGIRFFHCGEYGEQYGRPHYHACIFNFDFPDRELWSVRDDVRLYTSASLSELWPFGYAVIGDVTFQSAAYVARYIMKKQTGDGSSKYYEYISPDGEIFDRKPEYVTMSRRPGIAHGWYDKFKTDVFPSDFVVLNEKKMRPPKYYDRQYEAEFPDEFNKLRGKRVAQAKIHLDNNLSERMFVREQVQLARLSKLPRNLE